jgi:histidine ammonia-lyase
MHRSWSIASRARLHDAYRRVVPFLDRDRPLADDIRKSADFLKRWQ